MDALTMAFRDYRNVAAPLGGYENVPLNDLADGYCRATDEGDERNRGVYFSALILRFWYKINKMCSENQTLNLTREDCYDGLKEAILMACDPERRVWQRDPKLNFQQVLNQTLSTRFVAAAYYDSNLKKNQGKLNAISLDQPVDGDSGSAVVGDTVADESDSGGLSDGAGSAMLVQNCLDDNKIVEAVILDNIATKDVFRYDREVSTEVDDDGVESKKVGWSASFWPFRLVKELGSLDEDYVRGFLKKYEVSSKEALEAAVRAISGANNQKKYRMVNAALTDARERLGSSPVL